ncbi:hypothetical protein ACFRMO_08140 [Streptomyces anulatus]|uniref:hypothetical protein n=1 Tax=Streptomyces anulatus TaxID=1892 RepID=UPI0036B8496D
MSRSTTRARKRAQRKQNASARRTSLAFMDHMRAAEFKATGKHSSLGMLAADNLTKTHETVSDTFAAKRSPSVLPNTPTREAAKPSDMPKRSIWQAATGTPAPAPDETAETVKVLPAPELSTRVHTPIKAAELDKPMRAAAMRIVHREYGIHGWRLVGVINTEDGRRTVYARRHGASVRYSTAD